MTPPITFQEAQQAVAEKHGYASFMDLLLNFEGYLATIDSEAAELMARSWANYYVQQDRKELHDWMNRPPVDFSQDGTTQAIFKRPLPFPEER